MNFSHTIIGAALRPVGLPGPWKTFRSCDSFRALDDSAGLLDRLLGKCRVEDLLAAGVIQGEPGNFKLHSVLANNPTHVFVTTTGDGHQPMILSIASHCLGKQQPGWLTVLQAAVAGPLQKSSQPVLFARSAEDACVLWSAGLFATIAPATRLTCRSLSAIKSLTKSTKVNRGFDDTIVVADFSVAGISLQNDAVTDSFLAHLRSVQEFVDPNLKLKRWRPSTKELTKLGFSLRFGDSPLAARTLRESLAAATTIKPPAPVVPLPRFEIERDRYIDAVARRSSDIRAIRQALYKAVDAQFGEPLRKSISKSDDPGEQAIVAFGIEGLKQVQIELAELAARPGLTSELAHADPLGQVLKHAEQVRRLLSGSKRNGSSSNGWGQIK